MITTILNYKKKSLRYTGKPVGKLIRGKRVTLNGAIIDTTGGVTLGDSVHLGLEVMILSSSHPVELTGKRHRRRSLVCKPVIIGNNVCVGSRAIILSGVTIGDNAYIAAGSVVTK